MSHLSEFPGSWGRHNDYPGDCLDSGSLLIHPPSACRVSSATSSQLVVWPVLLLLAVMNYQWIICILKNYHELSKHQADSHKESRSLVFPGRETALSVDFKTVLNKLPQDVATSDSISCSCEMSTLTVPAYDASHLKSWNLRVRVGGWCWGPQHCVCRLCRSTQQLRCVGRIARCGAAAHHPHSAAGFPRPGNQMPHSHCQAKTRTSTARMNGRTLGESQLAMKGFGWFRHPYRAWPQSDLDRLACVWTGMCPVHHPISTHSRWRDIGIYVVPLSWEEIEQV